MASLKFVDFLQCSEILLQLSLSALTPRSPSMNIHKVISPFAAGAELQPAEVIRMSLGRNDRNSGLWRSLAERTSGEGVWGRFKTVFLMKTILFHSDQRGRTDSIGHFYKLQVEEL